MSNEKNEEQDLRSVEDIKGRFPEMAWVSAVSVVCLVLLLVGVAVSSLLIVWSALAAWVVLMVIGAAWKAADDHSVNTQKQRRFQSLAPNAAELDNLAAMPEKQQGSPGV